MNIHTHFTHRDAAILEGALPCPFCGDTRLNVVEWCDETGEYPAVECALCLGAAPASMWNTRALSSTPAVEPTAGDPLEYGLR